MAGYCLPNASNLVEAVLCTPSAASANGCFRHPSSPLLSGEMGCAQEALAVVAMVSTDVVFHPPRCAGAGSLSCLPFFGLVLLQVAGLQSQCALLAPACPTVVPLSSRLPLRASHHSASPSPAAASGKRRRRRTPGSAAGRATTSRCCLCSGRTTTLASKKDEGSRPNGHVC